MYRWMCDPEVSVNFGLSREPSLEQTEAWIRRALSDDSIRAFAILLDGGHVGNVVFDRIDRRLATARMSMYVGAPEARGRGVGLTALYRALGEVFSSERFYKVWLIVHERNTRAMRTYAALGFREEGVLRGEFFLGGERVAAHYMGLLADEYRRLPPPEERG